MSNHCGSFIGHIFYIQPKMYNWIDYICAHTKGLNVRIILSVIKSCIYYNV